MNNRIIKFRAWDAETQSMYPHEILVNDQWKVEEICNPMGGISVMQFTGLFDKNGIEIYEGDVIRYVSSADGINMDYVNFPVTFYQGMFILARLNEEPISLRDAIVCANNLNGIGIEIIGNVFENPELLK